MIKCDFEYYLLTALVIVAEIVMFVLTTVKVVPVEFGCIFCLCCVPILVILAIITEYRCKKYFKEVEESNN